MARPRKADRPVRLEISLPESLHSKLSIILFSSAEGRVPQGAWSSFFETLARQALDRLAQHTPQPMESNNGTNP